MIRYPHCSFGCKGWFLLALFTNEPFVFIFHRQLQDSCFIYPFVVCYLFRNHHSLHDGDTFQVQWQVSGVCILLLFWTELNNTVISNLYILHTGKNCNSCWDTCFSCSFFSILFCGWRVSFYVSMHVQVIYEKLNILLWFCTNFISVCCRVFKVLASFLSPTAFALGSVNFADYERAHVGLRWNNIWRVCSSYILFSLLYSVLTSST